MGSHTQPVQKFFSFNRHFFFISSLLKIFSCLFCGRCGSTLPTYILLSCFYSGQCLGIDKLCRIEIQILQPIVLFLLQSHAYFKGKDDVFTYLCIFISYHTLFLCPCWPRQGHARGILSVNILKLLFG